MDKFEARPVQKAGFWFTVGAVQALAVMFVCGWLIIKALNWFDIPARDATDPPGGRSQLALRTDHETGCQYLATRSGGLTPRRAADGRQICRENNQ